MDKKDVSIKPSRYKPSIQSANSLFHFMDKVDYLLSIIEKEAMIPRYHEETTEYLKIEYKNLAYPMICFCDINLHKIASHLGYYGGYGIAFSKEWSLEKGIQPLQYINPKSPLCDDFSQTFKSAEQDSEQDSELKNYLLSQMYYFKPIQGDMERDNKKEIKNFTDECEWRYIPDVKKDDLSQVILEEDLHRIDIFNESLLFTPNNWLRFTIDDIKHIIVKDEFDYIKIKDCIWEKEVEDLAKHYLISKIIIWNNIKGDL